MTKKIEVTGLENPLDVCKELEAGNLLFFEKIPFSFPQEEIDFLLAQKQSSRKKSKNIAYKPHLDLLSNDGTKNDSEKEKLKAVLKSYSEQVTQFLGKLLSPYSKDWKVDYTSFRPFQEKGRDLRLRARNDLLHFDAFPTRPLNGDRILRFFTNINPKEDRHWITSDSFEDLAIRYGGSSIAFPKSTDYSWKGRVERALCRLMAKGGVKQAIRSPYDQFMLQFHHFLKEESEFQLHCEKQNWHFPPGSCWAVFTDQVSHAALSGQYALEQTFFVPIKSLLFPEKSPLRVLERLTEGSLVFPKRG